MSCEEKDERDVSGYYGFITGDDKPVKNVSKYGVTATKVEELQPLDPSKESDNRGTKITPNVVKPCEEFEEILDMVGSKGKYQKFLLWAILCPIVTVSPFLVLNSVFMWDIPDHWCHVPGKPENMSIDEWKNATLTWEVGPDNGMRHSQCQMLNNSDGTGKLLATTCIHGWDYDKTDYESTIPSEFNWVCENDHYATDCYTYTNIGSAIGTVIFGILADKYGRKPIFFMSCGVNVLFKTWSLFVPYNFQMYKGLQLLGGMAFPALFSMPALISAEVSGTSYRSVIYMITWIIWVIGNSIIPFVAMICRGWFLFGCVAALPGFVLFFYWPIVDESPRWLITVEKGDEAIRILLKVAKTNDKKVDPDVIDRMVQDLIRKQKKAAENQSAIGVWTLFSKWNLAKNTIMLTIAWAMNMILYYGVTLNTTKMAGNKFLNYFMLSIIEAPAGFVAGKLVEITGRRWTQSAFFLLCTISCLICAISVVYPGSTWVVIAAALGIKFGVTITSLVVYLQGTEIFPTQLRSTGSGLASTVSSCMGIFGPYIIYTGTIHLSLPYWILCACCFLGTISATCLPETFKQHLPETIEAADQFGKDHKFWSYLPIEKEKTNNNNSQLH